MLRINELTKSYKDFNLQCSMEVKPGQITGLIGRNGAGKTTIFKAALGLIRYESGEVEILGKTASEMTIRDKENIGVVFADSGFSTYITVKGAVNILNQMYTNFNKEEFLNQCRRFNIPTDKKIKEFSTGMKAKLKLLTALSHKAKLLILDEPTVGLDVIARDELLDMLRNYMEQNEDSSILISSHISSDIETMCDDIYMIQDGRIILHEDTDVLLGEYGVLKMADDIYENVDKQFLLKVKKESYGYRCLTDKKQFYIENYPEIVVENGNIDDLVVMLNGGEDL